ncbi:hypothetical protein EVAR_38589_1 [Eumeta japonica]|uniref:Uncharacterized protein n=1 Tax=Eumeta variegata TaxID=151549 RepID=A0A4C1WTZ2_EUMVA|nr:hypothetical protein EVAR_38589_1 [Eumeta japonica]
MRAQHAGREDAIGLGFDNSGTSSGRAPGTGSAAVRDGHRLLARNQRVAVIDALGTGSVAREGATGFWFDACGQQQRARWRQAAQPGVSLQVPGSAKLRDSNRHAVIGGRGQRRRHAPQGLATMGGSIGRFGDRRHSLGKRHGPRVHWPREQRTCAGDKLREEGKA